MIHKSYGIVPVYHKGGVIEVLLIKHLAGHWGLPKGHADEGESPVTSARREFEEETGIMDYKIVEEEVFTDRYFFVQEIKGMKINIHKIVTYFVARVFSKNVKVQKSEIIDYKWNSPEEAEKLATYSGTKKIIKESAALFNKNDN